MRIPFLHKLILLLGYGWFLCNLCPASETNTPPSAPTYCWQKGEPIYCDCNHDGKIDLEVSGSRELAEGSDIYKVDTNYDGYYDVEYSFGIPITGKPTTNWTRSIHERVPVVGKDFISIKKPNWIEK